MERYTILSLTRKGKFRCHKDRLPWHMYVVCQMSDLRKILLPSILGAISELLDYISQDAPRQAPLGAAGKVSCETPSVELRLRRWRGGAGRRRTLGASDDALPPGAGGRIAVWRVRVPPPDSRHLIPESGAGRIQRVTSPRQGAVAHVVGLHHGGLPAGLSSCSAGNGPLAVIVGNGTWGLGGRTEMWGLRRVSVEGTGNGGVGTAWGLSSGQ